MESQTIHASCVAWKGAGALLLGPSGAGKSAIALQLMALGCDLVADDRVVLCQSNGVLRATCPQTIKGLIEARGVGILNADHVGPVDVALVVDLRTLTDERLPKRRTITFCEVETPLIHRVAGDHFVSAILQILKAGWSIR